MRKLSVVIPAYNEEANIEKTVLSFYQKLIEAQIPHELFVINDNSKDHTLEILNRLSENIPSLRYTTNFGPNGYGYAVRKGLMNFEGDCVVVAMADLSDDPNDLVNYYRTIEQYNCDMVFGSRWIKGAKVIDYPKQKRWINRFVNQAVRLMFGFKYNDVTNGFKLFSKETIEGVQPFLSGQFSLALEIPLKAIIRGYSYKVVPNNWYNRELGESNLKIKEMGMRYLFILLYCLNERLFSMGDFKKGKYNNQRT
jgi:dolichol-phosphate mannosyltransferase